jgi:hypothetical protein
MERKSTFVERMGGVVKDGLIVPDRPLPESAYVEIALPNAPREIVQRVRERHLARAEGLLPSGMGSGSLDVVIDPDVPALLRYHGAEQAFATLQQVLRECFPEMTVLTVSLEEDHDCPGWFRVVCQAAFPTTASVERIQEQKAPYYRRSTEAIPREFLPLFVTQFDVSGE